MVKAEVIIVEIVILRWQAEIYVESVAYHVNRSHNLEFLFDKAITPSKNSANNSKCGAAKGACRSVANLSEIVVEHPRNHVIVKVRLSVIVVVVKIMPPIVVIPVIIVAATAPAIARIADT